MVHLGHFGTWNRNTAPVAACGGLAAVILPTLPDALRDMLVEPAQDGAAGAIMLVRSRMNLLALA